MDDLPGSLAPRWIHRGGPASICAGGTNPNHQWLAPPAVLSPEIAPRGCRDHPAHHVRRSERLGLRLRSARPESTAPDQGESFAPDTELSGKLGAVVAA